MRREALATGTEGITLSRMLAAENAGRHQDLLALAAGNLAAVKADWE